ncbi:fungal-specific transcription factor domain-containing protein [Collybia nuda]|uniref:Fungal-specific transcription factor domain-containing protein n=1 Tax=Collybia nuda TaxID=64659 RepID=A0A9P6CK12_9AGAR|nr:fungal-specific transcription factor domain-containing protein [Collybia nuda]
MSPPFAYSSYYGLSSLPYPDHLPPLHYHHQDYPMSQHDHSLPHHDQSMSHSQSMQPPPSPSIPIDPALALYPPYYNYHQPQHHLPQHLSLPPNYSSPSSQGSDTLGTPPTEHMYPSSSSANINGKRPASSISNGTTDSRKKSRKDDESDAHSPSADKEETKAKPTRGSRACTVCRRLKMKCVGAEQGGPCKRCTAGNHECIFEESNRGKRSSKKHELLTRSLRKMERTLDTVLRSIGNPGIASGMVSRSPSPSAQTATTQALIAASPSPPPTQSSSSYQNLQSGSPKLHSLPDNALNPLGLLAEASLANRRAQGTHASPLTARNTESGDRPKMGVASDNYFKPGPMTILPLRRLYIERQVQPEMLSFVGTEDVVALFNIYFDHINMHCNLLDRNFHTPSLVCSRSPFLLTTICSISSKFYTAKPDLHPKLTELAKKLSFSVPAQGYKSVEIVQAYLLLSLWGCGAVERYEQDKTWLLLGMAIRMATDLNLHRKTAVTSQDTQEGKTRDQEVHNRERTWLMCFCLDRSFSAQMGKPHSIKEDSNAEIDNILNQELQRILSRCLEFLYSGTETPSGLQVHCDYMLVIKTFETQILSWREHWVSFRRWEGESAPSTQYKKLISQFYFHYAMLVLNSFGLQNALERSSVDIGHFFARCHTSATACAMLVRDDLGPSGFMKYSPDSHFVLTSYAVLSLLKLIRPEFQAFLDNEQKTLALVQEVSNALEKIAASSTHTPALYSGFLRALVSAKLDNSLANHNGSSNGDASAPHMQGGYQTGNSGEMPPPSSYGQQQSSYTTDPSFLLGEFQFESEMGPVADMSTFPPTMAPNPPEDNMGALTMDNILSSGFWDSVLVPGYNSMDGLSGGFVFGAGGSGLITPRLGVSPMHSGSNTPARGTHGALTQMSINAAFDNQLQDVKVDS